MRASVSPVIRPSKYGTAVRRSCRRSSLRVAGRRRRTPPVSKARGKERTDPALRCPSLDARIRRQALRAALSRAAASREREQSAPVRDVLLLDGIELKSRCCVVRLVVDTDGVKHPLGLWDGSTENATVATTLLA